MRIKISLLSLAFFSCAQVEPVFIDPELKPYIESYSDYSKRELGLDVLSVQKISVKFVDRFEKENQNGVCQIRIINPENKIIREVAISRYWWERMNEGSRLGLIFHEMGHCSLMRGHVEGRDSVMLPYTINVLSNKDLYIKELFQGSVLFNLDNPYYFLDRLAIAFVGMNTTNPRFSEHRSYINKGCSGLVDKH